MVFSQFALCVCVCVCVCVLIPSGDIFHVCGMCGACVFMC